MEALGLNFADWFILVVLVASGIISFTRGFTKEFLSLLLWLAAFIAAISLEYLATPKINEFIDNEEISKRIKCKFYLAGGKNDTDLINRFKNSVAGKNSISFEKMSIKETLPFIKNCNLCISNDTGLSLIHI